MKKKLTLSVIVIILVISGFYFRSDLMKISNDLSLKLQKFNKLPIDSLISDLHDQISTPPPLRANRQSPNSNLTIVGVIKLTNEERLKNGLKPLIADPLLERMALNKAQDMFKNQYFEHISPGGDGLAELAAEQGYRFIAIGENIAMGNFYDDNELVSDWLASPGHRENILSASYSQIGVAVVKGTFEGAITWMAVQEFGRPATECPEPSTALKSQIENYQSQIDALSKNIDSKYYALKKTNFSGQEQYNITAKEYNSLVEQYNNLASQIKSFISEYNTEVKVFNQCLKN